MLKKIGMIVGGLFAALLFIGVFVDKGPPNYPDRVSLPPHQLYPANVAPPIPEPAPGDPRPSNRRMSEAERAALLQSTIRRHGTPGARDWRDAMRAIIWADFAKVQCPALAFPEPVRQDIMTAWNLHVSAGSSDFIQSTSRHMAAEARSDKNGFCRKAWQLYGQGGATATLLQRTDVR